MHVGNEVAAAVRRLGGDGTHRAVHPCRLPQRLTAVDLVKACSARTGACDQPGAELRATLTLNPQALQATARLDAEYKARKGKVGPLHGIPRMLEANFDTRAMPTTGGNLAMRTPQPSTDAFTAERMRKAGAIVPGKTKLQEFACGGA